MNYYIREMKHLNEEDRVKERNTDKEEDDEEEEEKVRRKH